MAMVVLDCAFILAWALEEEGADPLVGILELVVRHRAEVPQIWALEVANALVKLVRRRKLKRERMRQILATSVSIRLTWIRRPTPSLGRGFWRLPRNIAFDLRRLLP